MLGIHGDEIFLRGFRVGLEVALNYLARLL